MGIAEILKEKREDILRTAARYGARNIRVFGSVTRGDAGPYSDVYFLVDMAPDRSLFDMGELLMDLQELLGRKVDVVRENYIYWLIRRRRPIRVIRGQESLAPR